MSDQFQTEALNAQPPEAPRPHPPVPEWLARRLLRKGEEITWVRGPKFNPSWERYITHPALFLAALVLGAAFLWLGWLIAGGWSEMSVLAPVAAAGLALGSIFVLGIASGYFTRLVVTDLRIVIVQGYEVCRTWAIDDLPRSLTRFRRREDGREERAIDLDTVQTMFGGASGHFAEAKTILAFGKQLDRIKNREDGPDRSRTLRER
jgi:hypothetical protein